MLEFLLRKKRSNSPGFVEFANGKPCRAQRADFKVAVERICSQIDRMYLNHSSLRLAQSIYDNYKKMLETHRENGLTDTPGQAMNAVSCYFTGRSLPKGERYEENELWPLYAKFLHMSEAQRRLYEYRLQQRIVGHMPDAQEIAKAVHHSLKPDDVGGKLSLEELAHIAEVGEQQSQEKLAAALHSKLGEDSYFTPFFREETRATIRRIIRPSNDLEIEACEDRLRPCEIKLNEAKALDHNTKLRLVDIYTGPMHYAVSLASNPEDESINVHGRADLVSPPAEIEELGSSFYTAVMQHMVLALSRSIFYPEIEIPDAFPAEQITGRRRQYSDQKPAKDALRISIIKSDRPGVEFELGPIKYDRWGISLSSALTATTQILDYAADALNNSAANLQPAPKLIAIHP